MQAYSPTNPALVGTSTLHPVLTPGVEYWLVVSLPEYPGMANWADSDPAILGRTWTRGTGIPMPIQDNVTLPAFRITGTPIVPAPGALALAFLGLALTRRVVRKRV
jgi:hypothetical protein